MASHIKFVNILAFLTVIFISKPDMAGGAPLSSADKGRYTQRECYILEPRWRRDGSSDVIHDQNVEAGLPNPGLPRGETVRPLSQKFFEALSVNKNTGKSDFRPFQPSREIDSYYL